MNKKNTFEDLIMWQKAHQFTLVVYAITKSFPQEEKYGLTSQFRRAAISIAANIAEGYKKKGKKDKLRFFNISQSSLEECRYYIILGRDLNYIKDVNKLEILINETGKLLNAYSKTIVNSLDS